MTLQTRYFGKLDVDEKDIIRFNNGLPGFEGIKRYILINNEEEGSPFKWIQGVDGSMPAFVIIDPFAVKKDYEVNLNDDVLKELEIKEDSDVAVFCIVVVPDDVNKMTMNLQAPLIINTVKKMGRQLILDTERYGVRHYILEELHGREESENARTDKEKRSVHHNK